MRSEFLMAALSLVLVGCGPQSVATPAPKVVQLRSLEEYLQQGALKDGTEGLAVKVQQNPNDSKAAMSLGVAQFLRALEHLAQGLYGYGLISEHAGGIPFLRLPVPKNPHPGSVSYQDTRKLFENLIVDLEAAETTFAKVHDDQVKLPVELGLVRFDVDGDGKADARLMDFAAQYLGGQRNLPKDPRLLTAFDGADACWFRGYCHLLMAQSEVILAYDGQEIFGATAHLFFARPTTPYPFLQKSDGSDFYNIGDRVDVIDVIALIHLIRMPVKEKSRMPRALGHLEQVISLSRDTWKLVLAEKDNDHEWLPGPKQDGVLGVKVSQQLVDGWHQFLDESEALLQGKRLIPFWRKGETRGVNLRKAFTDPGPFDLVLWIQGTAAAPYLEQGTLTRKEVWARLMDVFRGQFVGFALWFN